MNTTELKAAESALETALEQVRQLIASEAEQKPKPEPVRGPLMVAPEIGSVYWYVAGDAHTNKSTWTNHAIDHKRLAIGNVFASERDAEYKAAFDEIWSQPIGEWEPEGYAYLAWAALGEPYHWGRIVDNAMKDTRRLWRKGELGFGGAGKAELERRLAEQKKLDERFGL